MGLNYSTTGDKTTLSFSAGTGSSTSTPNAPMKTCFEDSKCYENPLVRSAQNFISVCRTGHGVFFLAYALLLLIVIIMVWLTSNGSISGVVNAWVDTFICVVVILLMWLHFFLYVKGVIPECCASETCSKYANAPEPKTNLSTEVDIGVEVQ
jgi:hypothetical protein